MNHLKSITLLFPPDLALLTGGSISNQKISTTNMVGVSDSLSENPIPMKEILNKKKLNNIIPTKNSVTRESTQLNISIISFSKSKLLLML